jgi:hypothetical protein
MPVLTIKNPQTDAPTDFFYLDSGAPDCDVYTTLVVVHGLYFHSGEQFPALLHSIHGLHSMTMKLQPCFNKFCL